MSYLRPLCLGKTLSPLVCGIFPRIIAPSNRPANPVSGTAILWVGAIRNSLLVAVVQLPLTRAAITYIGNLGIRKPEKIRKIGNAWFAHPITNYSAAIYNRPANYNWQERNKRTNRHGESITANRQGVAFKAGSPLQAHSTFREHLEDAASVEQAIR